MNYEFKDNFDFPTFLEGLGQSFTENSTGNLIFSECPFCGKAKKMYVAADTGVFNCFSGSCGEKGGPAKLVMHITGKDFSEVKELLFGDGGISISSILQGKAFKDVKISLGANRRHLKNDPGSILLPTELIPLDKNRDKEAWDYLIKRGYREEVINDLNLLILPYKSFGQAWGEISKGRFPNSDSRNLDEEEKVVVKEIARLFGRIVFPVVVDNEVRGFVARDYQGGKIPKVLNSRGNFRSFSVWNYDNAKDSEILVVCEGNTSAIKCGHKRSIALLGKTATLGQVKTIRDTKAKKIVICFDVGTQHDQDALFKDLSLYYNEIYTVSLPPVISLPEDMRKDVSVETFDKLNKFGNLNLSYKNGELYVSESDRLALERVILSENEHFSIEEQSVVMSLPDLEYKDPGDYTEREMEDFIKKARKMRHKLII